MASNDLFLDGHVQSARPEEASHKLDLWDPGEPEQVPPKGD